MAMSKFPLYLLRLGGDWMVVKAVRERMVLARRWQ
jgi:hypothetical protein